MNHQLKEKALELTSTVLHEYWHLKPELFILHLHDNVLWIGSMDSEYIHGAENVKKRIYDNIGEMVDVNLKDEEYEIVHSDNSSCLVAGRYTAYTKPETGHILSEKQRVTFEWVYVENELKIIHLHLSNILHIQQEEELFPTIAGKTTFDYVKEIVQKKNGFSKISVKDVNGIQMFIPDFNIIYINSDGNYIEIHSTDRIIRCHTTLKFFLESLTENFIMIGRKYIINTENVIGVKEDTIQLIDDHEIKIPAKNIKETIRRIKNSII